MEQRIKIITLNEHTTKNQRQIADAVGVSQATVNRIIKQHQETGSITANRVGKCGPKRKTTAKDDMLLVRNSKINPRKSDVDLTRELHEGGINVHVTTVRQRLREAGRFARKPIKKQLLTQAMMKKRYLWAKKYQDWTVEDWKMVIFSDESHFLVQGEVVRFVRRSAGEKLGPAHIQQAPKHPEKKCFGVVFRTMV